MVGGCKKPIQGADHCSDATNTRSEIIFVVNKVCQSMSHSLTLYKGQKNSFATLKCTLTAFSDAGWTSDPDDSFFCRLSFFVGQKTNICCRIKYRSSVPQFSSPTVETVWIQTLLGELNSTVTLSQNHILHARTKHMVLDLFC